MEERFSFPPSKFVMSNNTMKTIMALGIGGLTIWLAFKASKAMAAPPRKEKKKKRKAPKAIPMYRERIPKPAQPGITYKENSWQVNIPWSSIFGQKSKQPEQQTYKPTIGPINFAPYETETTV